MFLKWNWGFIRPTGGCRQVSLSVRETFSAKPLHNSGECSRFNLRIENSAMMQNSSLLFCAVSCQIKLSVAVKSKGGKIIRKIEFCTIFRYLYLTWVFFDACHSQGFKVGRCFLFVCFSVDANTGTTAGVHKLRYFSIELALLKKSAHEGITFFLSGR